jgi:hypothetical protein
MNTRTILAVVLSLLVFLIFTFLGERYGTKPPAETPAPKVAEPAKPGPPARVRRPRRLSPGPQPRPPARPGKWRWRPTCFAPCSPNMGPV